MKTIVMAGLTVGVLVLAKAGVVGAVAGLPPLTPGWNLVGLMATADQPPVAVTELGSVTSVWKWATVNGQKGWAVYLPGEVDQGGYAAAKGFGQLDAINPGEGFWVNVPATSSACGGDNDSPDSCGKLLDAPVEKGAQTIAQLNKTTTDNGLQVLTGTAKCDVKVAQINYLTPGVQPGEVTNASATVLIPGGDDVSCQGPLPLIAFARGTALAKGYSTATDITDPTTMLLLTFFVSQGYAVVATDYLGYALSEYPFHPYMHADTEASAVIDSIRGVRNAASALGLTLNGKVMVGGYSQGGHAAMAAQRAIESDHAAEFNLVAAAHLAGPYNVSQALIDGVVNPILGVQYFVPFQITAWQQIYGNLYLQPSDVFNPPYDGFIEGLLPVVNYPFDLAKLPGPALTPEAARDTLFTSSYLTDLATNPDSGTTIAAKKQDLLGWNPKAPTALCGGSGDPTVKFSINAQMLHDDFLSRGVNSVTLVDVDATIKAIHGNVLTSDPATYDKNYHSAYEPPLCAAEARKLFDQHK
jgi:pimeloyl-ACP methyl ester carboxylesterase